MRNEKGYTLILVMVMMTVVVVLGLALNGMAMTANKQFTKTDNKNKATDLAEMGITYYKTELNNMIAPAKVAMETNKTNFCTEFKNQYIARKSSLKLLDLKTVENQNSYQIIVPTTMTAIDCNSTSSDVTVNFTSKGKTTSEDATLTSKIIVSKVSRAGNPAPKKDPNLYPVVPFSNTYINSSTGNYYYSGFKLNDNGTHVVNNPSAWFEAFRSVGGWKGSVEVLHEAIFEEIDINGKSELNVYGDAIFLEKNAVVKQTSKAEICIKGDVYYVKDGKLEEFTDAHLYFDNSCVNSNSNWYIDENDGIVVNY